MATYVWHRYTLITATSYEAYLIGSKKFSDSSWNDAVYKSKSSGYPSINENGKFIWTGCSKTCPASSSQYTSNYWAATSSAIQYNTSSSSQTDYFCEPTKASSSWGTWSVTANFYGVRSTTSYAKGDYIDDVTSSSPSTYPQDGYSGDYWYVYVGELTTKTLSVTYNGSTIISVSVEGDVAISYNGAVIATVPFSGGTKTLLCSGKIMASNVTLAGKSINCSGKLMASNIVATIS